MGYAPLEYRQQHDRDGEAGNEAGQTQKQFSEWVDRKDSAIECETARPIR